MTEFEFLKRLCKDEEKRYELKQKINKTRELVDKTKNDLKKCEESYDKKINPIRKEMNGLKDKMDYLSKAAKEDVKSKCIKYMLISAGVILAILILIYLIAINWIGVTNPINLAFCTGLSIVIPIFAIILLFSLFDFDDTSIFFILLGVLGAVFLILLLYLFFSFSFKLGFNASGSIFALLFVLQLANALTWYFRYKYLNGIKRKDYIKTRDEKNVEYKSTLASFNKIVDEKKGKINFYNSKINAMENDIKNYKIKLNEIDLVIRNLYATNTIHPSYQNWDFAEKALLYFELGLCISLKGEKGAYDIYRREQKEGSAISAIRGVSTRISNVEINQRSMQEQMNRIERNLDSLIYLRYFSV